MAANLSSTDGQSPDAEFDVVVIGGAFSGAASALLLKRLMPDARVLLVERLARFDRKVGEATVEISSYFLHHVLGLYDYLSRHQLPKHGLRFWFTDRSDRRLAEMSEVGGADLPLLGSFQLDRAALDDHLLQQAGLEGAEVWREARLETLELGWPQSSAVIAMAGRRRQVKARWIVDASGRDGWIATRTGRRRFFDSLPTAAIWARWRNVADMDAADGRLFDRRRVLAPARRLATNHFMGYGWWCWVIPLRGGETSIGVVYDKSLVDPRAGGDGPRAAYQRFVAAQPGLRELIADAEMDPDDFKLRDRLPYTVDRYCDKGWALVGDAASFLDPFYSPGLDHASMSVFATTRLIGQELAGQLPGQALDDAVAAHNGRFTTSLPRWLEAIYVDKYEIMGDAELMRCSFLVDTSLYYLQVVGPVYADPDALGHPPFGMPVPQTAWAAAFMRFFKGRMVKLARFRLKTGQYGCRNAGWRAHGRAFGLGPRSVVLLCRGLGAWLRLELGYLWHRVSRGAVDVSVPAIRAARPVTERAPATPSRATTEMSG